MVLAVVAGVTLIAGTAAVTATLMRTPGPSTTGGEPARVAAPQPVTVTEPPKVVWPTPAITSITLTVKVLRKACFGSAGCNLTYSIEVEYGGGLLERGKVWDVTYVVKGGEDERVDTLQLEGTADGYQFRTRREEVITTPSSSAMLTATVTAVSAH